MILPLVLAIGVVGANSLALSPIAADVAASFGGAAASDVMIASAAYGAGTAISALLLAPRADRIGLAASLLMALSALVLAMVLSACAWSVLALIAAQAIAGLAAGVALPAIYGLAAEIAPPGRESETLGKVLTGWTLSLVAGVTLAAALSDVVHWRLVYAAMALIALSVCAALTLLRRKRPARPDGDGAAATRGSAASPFGALRVPGVPALLMLVAGFMTAFYGLYAYLGAHLTGTLGLSTALAGLTALAYGMGFGGVAPLDRLIDRFGRVHAAPAVLSFLMLVYLALAAMSDNAFAILGLCVVWGGANHLGLNLLVGALTASDISRRGAILGLYTATSYGAMSLGTAIFKPVFERYGFAALACVSAACVLPGVIHAVFHALVPAAAAKRRGAAAAPGRGDR
ncbi:MFS transporter [Amaricoccus sp. W119]|uniref:MFS transporter n=1 Tax=Amaricoccus sp. W119 TaxID=3391833 RepID=UPI0039A49AD5